MKKVILLTALLACAAVNAQFIAWENTFDTPEERAGWIFYDGNNNNNTWNIGKHVVRQAASPNMYEEVSPDFVLRHSAYIPNVVGGPANFQNDYLNDNEDWVISPEIDLTGASGAITLAAMIGRVITYNTTSASNNTDRHVFVYVSTPAKPVPDIADFQTLRTDITTAHNNGSNPNVEPKMLKITNADYIAASSALFAQATADLSQYAGQKIYIGFWHNVNIADNSAGISTTPFKDSNSSKTFQIDEMQVFAETLGVSDFEAKESSKIIQNPVGSDLVLQLNPSFAAEATGITVYNMLGQQVLSSAYAPQINVNALAQGTYILRIINGNTAETLKFIKK